MHLPPFLFEQHMSLSGWVRRLNRGLRTVPLAHVFGLADTIRSVDESGAVQIGRRLCAVPGRTSLPPYRLSHIDLRTSMRRSALGVLFLGLALACTSHEATLANGGGAYTGAFPVASREWRLVAGDQLVGPPYWDVRQVKLHDGDGSVIPVDSVSASGVPPGAPHGYAPEPVFADNPAWDWACWGGRPDDSGLYWISAKLATDVVVASISIRHRTPEHSATTVSVQFKNSDGEWVALGTYNIVNAGETIITLESQTQSSLGNVGEIHERSGTAEGSYDSTGEDFVSALACDSDVVSQDEEEPVPVGSEEASDRAEAASREDGAVINEPATSVTLVSAASSVTSSSAPHSDHAAAEYSTGTDQTHTDDVTPKRELAGEIHVRALPDNQAEPVTSHDSPAVDVGRELVPDLDPVVTDSTAAKPNRGSQFALKLKRFFTLKKPGRH
ncbi:unnamed protein product (mitochondrion) [Plasmodiophora brassicae]|uniref:Uncharacterized protein n=2 Tax=Plasmodiophora brassicae TaxID=37360 RepID=A0A3P3YFF3_PLABS|nr:unnamed protein product [Plasmodiophora brassicae]